MNATRESACAHRVRAIVACAAGALLAACASTQLDAQWADPDRPAASLRGARVLVACEAHEAVIRRICQDRVAAEIVARGATPVLAAENTAGADSSYAQAARSAGARAILTQHIAPYGSTISPGFSVGLGGFGFGSGRVGAGVGVSAPIGGGQVTTGYAANSRLTDATTGKLLWTAKASSPPSQDVQGQMMELTRAVFDSADKLGLF
ncbi:hypothetical protein [Piscinibacter sp. XHJ-5]|uniref:hypothetical protein n=1 Tax=Piscinibacter sp. XHJ-5 TaxID=3037797 RepID=UPI0024532E1E|nr:hypothetical protein [Piscinibacter sp. XHJ-5]